MYKRYKSPTNDEARLQTLINVITQITLNYYKNSLGYDTVTEDSVDKIVPKRFGQSDYSSAMTERYGNIQYDEDSGEPYVPHLNTMNPQILQDIDYDSHSIDLSGIVEE